jgi:soluble lytic murein transglycosylase
MLARERLRAIGRTPSAPAVIDFLRGIQFPPRARRVDFAPDAPTRSRLERFRLLSMAGLEDFAEMELRFASRADAQSHVLAIELAKLSMRRSVPDQAIRYIKRYAPGYLFLPIDSAPAEFWKLAFPLPYREALEQYSRENGLDPFLVAALIRQESEFNPRAISRAQAYGLTQVRPGTGRELSRRLKMPRFATSMLFQPEVNLRLGTYYLKALNGQLGGKWEATLAAYNAGKSRADAWLTWADFREPAEFVETVPFTETRDYIQIVLRNAEIYRRLYGGQ